MKAALQTPERLGPEGAHRPWLETPACVFSLPNAGPLWLTNTLMRTVDEALFAASLKFAVGRFGVPLWWGVLFGLGTGFVGLTVGGGAVLLSALALVVHILLVRWSNPPHPID